MQIEISVAAWGGCSRGSHRLPGTWAVLDVIDKDVDAADTGRPATPPREKATPWLRRFPGEPAVKRPVETPEPAPAAS